MSVIIPFQDIYAKAIGLFDDPKITAAYNSNLMQFYKLMYVYLQNSISLFNNPLSVIRLISNYEEPNGLMEIFESDGETVKFKLDEAFQLIEGSVYCFVADGEQVEATIDKANRTVTFPEVLPLGKQFSIEQYFAGQFVCDMSHLSSSTLVQMNIISNIKDILSRLLVKSWGENQRNFLLDIQNILTDSDFGLHSSSSALRAKNIWVEQLDEEIMQYQNKLAWNIRISNG